MKVKPLRLSVFMTGDPARRLKQLAQDKDLSMNQVVRKALNIWGRLEEAMPQPTDVLFIRHADGTETPLRLPS